MEKTPSTSQALEAHVTEPRNPNYLPEQETQMERRRHNREIIAARISRERSRLGLLMAMAHSAVHLTLRNESNPRVRKTVRKQLERRYGLKATPIWWNYRY